MKILKNIRVIILIAAILLSIAAINPRPWQSGVTIRSVEPHSAAALAGMSPSDPGVSPVLSERIISINSIPVTNEADYYSVTGTLPPNVTITVETNKDLYSIRTLPLIEVTTLNQLETVNVTEEVFNNETNTFENNTKRVTRNKTVEKVVGTKSLGIVVYNAPKTNIRMGLDLSGGARVLLQPAEPVTQDQMDIIIDTLKERINKFGIADIVVREVKDLSGNNFILVEVAGASEKDVRELVVQQGKFEAKIANQTTFRGGEDITYVCRSPECSGIKQGCRAAQEGYACTFDFSITLTPQAAERQANITKNLAVVGGTTGEPYLEKPLDLYLDDELVDSLQISAGLKGSAVTQISISGPGVGATERAAAEDALANMKQMQTILITGSLPVKLIVVKTDTISAELGDEFINNAIFVGILAFIAVTITMIVRYRNLRISIPVIITLISEVTIILGLAALFKWNMDLAAFAGILVAIGTGVDDPIVIADETIGNKRKGEAVTQWKQKLQSAFFIIFAAYFTALASLLPLLWAGAGLVKFFAITSIAGISAGVLITRPAFAAIMEYLEQTEE